MDVGCWNSTLAEWATSATARYEVGSIAGTMSVGMGRLVARFEGENDGTVAVDETELQGMTDHLCMPVSHSGMVLSTDVVDQVAAFLKHGKFNR